MTRALASLIFVDGCRCAVRRLESRSAARGLCARSMRMTHLDRRNVLKLFGATATSSLAMTSASFAEISNDEFASNRKRRFVLIHGAWQNASAWDGVVRVLRRAGHEVEAPTLPGMAP